MQLFTRADVSKTLKIPYHCVRYAEEIGRIPSPDTGLGGRRIYTVKDMAAIESYFRDRRRERCDDVERQRRIPDGEV